MHCGIGAYAEQQVNALRREGAVVDVLSPPEGDGDYATELNGGARSLRLLRYLWAYDRVYVHFAPSFYYDAESGISRGVTSLALLFVVLFFGRRIHFVIHETASRPDEPPPSRGMRRSIDRWIWKLSARVVLHSERERDAFAEAYGLSPTWGKFEVESHERHFVSHCDMDRLEARRRLGIARGSTLFLCIGFIQPHKGFDRVIRAMRETASPDALLWIVGSVRIDWEPARDYAERLHEEVEADARCEFDEAFLSDELFDAWIVAADYVMIPYRESWSSGVAARAKIHGRPVVASRRGGLAEQLPEGSHLFDSDEELAAILNELTAPRERLGSQVGD